MSKRNGLFRTPSVLLVFSCLLGATARAQTADPMAAMKQACAGDYFQLCAGADPYGDAVQMCFDTNHDRLSRDCRTAIDAYHRKYGAMAIGR